MSLDLTEDKSTLIQVMAWCRQAASHYLGQCWPRSVSPDGVIRPQCVKCTHSVHFAVVLLGHRRLDQQFHEKGFEFVFKKLVCNLDYHFHTIAGTYGDVALLLSKHICKIWNALQHPDAWHEYIIHIIQQKILHHLMNYQ